MFVRSAVWPWLGLRVVRVGQWRRFMNRAAFWPDKVANHDISVARLKSRTQLCISSVPDVHLPQIKKEIVALLWLISSISRSGHIHLRTTLTNTARSQSSHLSNWQTHVQKVQKCKNCRIGESNKRSETQLNSVVWHTAQIEAVRMAATTPQNPCWVSLETIPTMFVYEGWEKRVDLPWIC